MKLIKLDYDKLPKVYPVLSAFREYKDYIDYAADKLEEHYPNCNFIFLVKGTSGAVLSAMMYDCMLWRNPDINISILQSDCSDHREPFQDLASVLAMYPPELDNNIYAIIDDFSATGKTVQDIIGNFKKEIYWSFSDKDYFEKNIGKLDLYISTTVCIKTVDNENVLNKFHIWNDQFKAIMASGYED